MLINFFFRHQPERINPTTGNQGYDVRSDVWSLGISMVRSFIPTFNSIREVNLKCKLFVEGVQKVTHWYIGQ